MNGDIPVALRQCQRASNSAYFNVPTGTDVLGDWKSVLEDLVTRADRIVCIMILVSPSRYEVQIFMF